MKKIFKQNVVVVMLFTMLCSYGTEISSLNTNEDGKTTLMLNDVKQGEQLIIKDNHGVILYNEAIKQNGLYVKSFDLTNLPDGTYNFELDTDFKIKIIPFEVKLSDVKFNKNEEKVIYKPFVELKDNKLYITKLNLNKTPLKVRLSYDYNKNNFEVLHSETIKNKSEIKRIYEISKANKGTYKLTFYSEGRVFENIVQL